MIEKLKPGSRAFILVLGAIILSVIMAMSSYFTPDIAPSYEMVTAAPQSGVGGYSEQLPNCIRCGGTDCVIWLPEGAEVTSEVVKGMTNEIAWIVLTTENAAFDNSLRDSIIKENATIVPGTSTNVRVTHSENGYAGRESTVYEEMRVRQKVSLRTRNGYFFSYLLHTPNGTGIIVSASCEGYKKVSEARKLVKSIAYSLQRNDEQDAEVKMAIQREAKTGSVTENSEELEEDTYDIFDSPNKEDEKMALKTEEKTQLSRELEINGEFSLYRSVQKGDAIVVSWENRNAAPTSLMIVSPSEEILYPDEAQGLTGMYVFWATKDEPEQGWQLIGETQRQLGNTYPTVKTYDEFAEQFWE